jgi:hypothetical protein|tara:strand:- start:3142 stop:3531 length:390 start_codon:yes stop_codon:yes gene_type:complete
MQLSSNEIRDLVQKQLKVNLLSKKRTRNLVLSRTLYYKLCRECTHLTFQEIGNTLNFSHCNVIHGISNIFPQFRFFDKKYLNAYNQILLYNDKTPLNKKFEFAQNENKYLRKQLKDLRIKLTNTEKNCL